ncbi:MAG: 23S rRNA (guanosine(2251)-2'-O)-methyltransferase RlmB [Calditrichaeota bacterium]|nr:23S rRNA (guanosine(2251)-2'-O)-methyltransferase RlmB [Calditrichota bacterium]
MKADSNQIESIYGRHVVETALKVNYPIRRILIANTNQSKYKQIEQLAMRKGIRVEKTHNLNQRFPQGTVHQGIVAEVDAFPYKSLEDILATIKADQKSLVIVLDQITDPHNLGAIIRSAESAGATAIVIPSSGGATVNATVFKVSAATAFYQPIVLVNDLIQAINQLKENGFTVYSTAMQAEKSFSQIDYARHSCLVIGNEETGIRKQIRNLSDVLIKIPIYGKSESLNASVAAGICIYGIVERQ